MTIMPDGTQRSGHVAQHLQQLATHHCQRAESQLQAAARHLAGLLHGLARHLQLSQQSLAAGPHTAALLCSISDAHNRRTAYRRRNSGPLGASLQARPLGDTADTKPGGSEAGKDSERILISEVRHLVCFFKLACCKKPAARFTCLSRGQECLTA